MHPGKIILQALRTAFRKTATLNYPAERTGMPQGFRGKIAYFNDKCIGCLMCVRDCPSGAIQIRKVGEKQFEADVDLSKCIYCGQCADSCPKKAISITSEFELAALDPKTLKITFRAKPQEEPPKPA